jgi:hypothetical protein
LRAILGLERERRDPDLVQSLDPLVLAIIVKLAAAP